MSDFRWAALDEVWLQAAATAEGAPKDDEWGRSESLDPDNVGDIADEGHGHRG